MLMKPSAYAHLSGARLLAQGFLAFPLRIQGHVPENRIELLSTVCKTVAASIELHGLDTVEAATISRKS